jgi:acyl dehydratase
MKASDLTTGDQHTEVVVHNLTRTQIIMYAGASGDFNPLHHDEIWATTVASYPSIFAHGQLTMALTARALTSWLDEAELTRLGAQFRKQVWPGDSLTVTATVTAATSQLVDIDVVTINQHGDKVLTGYATAQDIPAP